MDDTRHPVSIAPLLTTVVIIAACTSALWLYFWHTHDQARAHQLESLSAEFDQRREAEAYLLEKYTVAEEARRLSEQALLETRNRLDATEQVLARLEAADWEARYRAAAEENYDLTERITELELRHAITRDHLETERSDLLDTHTALERAFTALEDEHAELRQTHHEMEALLAAKEHIEQGLRTIADR
jgi:hypothetical protein